MCSAEVDHRFRCSCGKSYKHRPSLYNHRKFECNREPMFKCSKCSYRAKLKANDTLIE
ncbi:longitudinals lacking protein, isoforms A/B/D/L-like isoform X3 [Rhodnius prolixus]|uniref:longitudinals lacking protein, isoforms A/B/D/L-like isoform X3 n=1 Tax=Rhodnius prolixus TaxID=13249 RepID=UPI003D18B1A3